MSVAAPASGPPAAGLPWGLWLRQVIALMRLETRRIFRGKGTIFLILLPAMPVMIPVGLALFPPTDEAFGGIAGATQAFAVAFQTFIAPFVVFVGCAIVFSNLFRKELLEKTLHYGFLTPVRREVLTAGKYAAGLAATSGIFLTSTLVTYLLLYLPYGLRATANHLFLEYGLAHLLGYLGVTFVACLGYGAIFMLCGILVRNPIFPAIALLAWEHNSHLLPPLLKKLTVIHYLRSMSPVPLPSNKEFEILADPTPAWVAIPGFLVVTAAVLLLCALKVRRLEVTYGDD